MPNKFHLDGSLPSCIPNWYRRKHEWRAFSSRAERERQNRDDVDGHCLDNRIWSGARRRAEETTSRLIAAKNSQIANSKPTKRISARWLVISKTNQLVSASASATLLLLKVVAFAIEAHFSVKLPRAAKLFIKTTNTWTADDDKNRHREWLPASPHPKPHRRDFCFIYETTSEHHCFALSSSPSTLKTTSTFCLLTLSMSQQWNVIICRFVHLLGALEKCAKAIMNFAFGVESIGEIKFSSSRSGFAYRRASLPRQAALSGLNYWIKWAGKERNDINKLMLNTFLDGIVRINHKWKSSPATFGVFRFRMRRRMAMGR